MTDHEKRAHDLAVVFAQALHADLGNQLDQSTLEFLWQSFATDYEAAYEYFKTHLS